jgi:environmental stress-induced protein Ves
VVARVPDHDEWDWRVSIADVVQDGLFSLLPGVDRTIAVVEGEGMLMTVDGIEHRVLAAVHQVRWT